MPIRLRYLAAWLVVQSWVIFTAGLLLLGMPVGWRWAGWSAFGLLVGVVAGATTYLVWRLNREAMERAGYRW